MTHDTKIEVWAYNETVEYSLIDWRVGEFWSSFNPTNHGIGQHIYSDYVATKILSMNSSLC